MLPFFGQRKAAAPALTQAKAKLAFQLRHRIADRGNGNPQLLLGPAIALKTGHRLKNLELSNVKRRVVKHGVLVH